MSGQLKLRREVFNALNDYIKHLQKNYEQWTNRDSLASDDIRKQMIKDFGDTLTIKRDKLYTKVIVRGSAHSIIVMENYSKFKRGDILRVGNKGKPDLNFVHGNVLEEKYEKITWAGI
jgi:hypothetical protein